MTERTVPAENFTKLLASNVDNKYLNDTQFREFVRNSLSVVIGGELPETEEVERRRKPNLHGRRWPPNMSVEDIDKAIDDLCGCAGKYDCDCVSVTSQACGEAWEKYSTRER